MCLRHPAVRLPAGPRVPLVRADPFSAGAHRHIRGAREPQAQRSEQLAAKLCRELGLADEAQAWSPSTRQRHKTSKGDEWVTEEQLAPPRLHQLSQDHGVPCLCVVHVGEVFGPCW